MTEKERKEQLIKAAQTPDEELVSELIIANHNIESCSKKMQEYGRTDSLMELFTMFCDHYSIVHEEILRRMRLNDSKR